MQARVLWTVSFYFFFEAVLIFVRDSKLLSLSFGQAHEIKLLRRVSDLLLEIEETLSAGLIPTFDRWEAIRKLHAPWGKLASESLDGLRSQGGALLPTLRRIRALSQQHGVTLADSRAKSAQSIAQALVCAALLPIFGVALYNMLPCLAQHSSAWFMACVCGLFFTILGALWMVQIAESARWAGLQPDARSWILISYCAGERFLAAVRSGTPADLAWLKVCEQISKDSPELALAWGASIWKVRGELTSTGSQNARELLIELGASIKKAVQLSLMEGRPCAERVESTLEALRQQMRACVDRELSLLQTRALKPLFLCVAPTLFALLAFGLAISWSSVSGGGFDL